MDRQRQEHSRMLDQRWYSVQAPVEESATPLGRGTMALDFAVVSVAAAGHRQGRLNPIRKTRLGRLHLRPSRSGQGLRIDHHQLQSMMQTL